LRTVVSAADAAAFLNAELQKIRFQLTIRSTMPRKLSSADTALIGFVAADQI